MKARLVGIEPLTEQDANVIRRGFPGIQGMIMRLDDIDISRGAGIMDDGYWCVWTKDGHRISLSQGHGTRIGSCSKEPDPEAPEAA